MTAPGSGDAIVSAQTDAQEGARTGFVQLLGESLNEVARYCKAADQTKLAKTAMRKLA
jgi:hypothetical protein